MTIRVLILDYHQRHPIGYLAYGIVSKEAEIIRLGVKTEFRRQSIGRRMIDEMIFVRLRSSKGAGIMAACGQLGGDFNV